MGLVGGATPGAAGSAQVSGSDVGIKCGPDTCQQNALAKDRFCRYCGFSRKKCAACGKGLPETAVNFCPSCGATRGGQQVVRISPTSSRARAIGSVVKIFAAPVLVLLIAGFILAQPTVSRSTAQSFFDNYFTQVENTTQRAQLYAQDLTPSFKQLTSNQPGPYNTYWNTVKSADVGPAYPVSGNSFEFTVSVKITYKPGTYTYGMTGGRPDDVRVNFWFVCTGFRGTLLGRVPWEGCPDWALKIDSEQDAPLPSGNGSPSLDPSYLDNAREPVLILDGNLGGVPTDAHRGWGVLGPGHPSDRCSLNPCQGAVKQRQPDDYAQE